VTAPAEKTRDGRACWIVAARHVLPGDGVPNEALPASLGIDADGLRKKTGITARHWAREGVYASDLGVEAARKLLDDLAVESAEIDCIIAATQTADHFIPGIGVAIQAKIGLANIPAYDIRNQCSGFLYALEMAQAFIVSGRYHRILIVCAEVQSHGLGFEPQDAAVSALFADGAAAVLVADHPIGPRPLRVTWIRLGADGKGAAKLRHRLWDISQIPPWDLSRLSDPPPRHQYAEMDGEAVFRAAVKKLSANIRDCLDALGLEVSAIDWLLPHQANAAINRTVASIAGFPEDRVLGNIETVGNVSGASIPILLSETLHDGRITMGQKVMLAVFGAGFTWGTAVLEAV
jgi:3-oxoacyl-[acyl-carrier-protein] synthase III